MTSTTEDLKRRVEAAAVASDGKVQFSPELRRDIVAYSHEQQAMGRSQHSIASDLGMKGWTLNRWHQNERKPKSVAAKFIEVSPRKVRGAASAMVPFEVTCPNGFEVRVPAVFETGALRDLLTALEGR
jgi:transposase-like protein